MVEDYIDTGRGTGVGTTSLRPLVHNMDEFEAAIGTSLDPVDAVIYHFYLGALDKAEKALDKALRKGPGAGDFRIRTLAADIQTERGDYAQAKAVYRHLLDEETDPNREAILRQHLGRVFFVAQDYSAAAECFGAALRLRRALGAPESQVEFSAAALRLAQEHATAAR